MTDPFHAQIRALLEAVHIDATNAFWWFGTEHRPAATLHGIPVTSQQQRALLALGLQDHLYRHFYCPGTAVHHVADWNVTGQVADEGTFASRLARANRGRGHWEPGWRVTGHDDAAVLTKGGLTIVVPFEDCRINLEAAVGTAAVRHPSGSFHRSPGFYVAYGDTAAALQASDRLVRLYWNVASTGADVLAGEITGRLNAARVPFELKILDEPAAYVRCDAAVLYVGSAAYGDVISEHVPHVLHSVSDHLAPAVPALTKRLAPGLGVAESPAGPHSFGWHRCGVLARAVVAGNGRELSERLSLTEREFRRVGIDLRAPYLNPGSADVYQGLDRDHRRPHPRVRRHHGTPSSDVHDPVEVALDIGWHIVDTAVWHEDRCNWIAALGPASRGSPRTRFGSLGPDVYDGTSGIALFLAELSELTGDARVRRTALGAIEHALATAADAPPGDAAWYVGPLGTAAVAARLGQRLERDDLTVRARRLATSLRIEPSGFDLMSGAAGCIVGLLAVHDLLADDRFMDTAEAVGEHLIAAAVSSADGSGASWGSRHAPDGQHLTGFSHGTAGAAYALLKLFAKSGRESLRVTAEGAMDYERAWFSPEQQNWPDFREVTRFERAHVTRLPYSTTWCHGAPGIALSRLLAAELLADGRYRDEATVALRTTREHLRRWINSPGANYSLCHGLAGDADVVLHGLRALEGHDVDAESLVHDVAQFGRATYFDSGAPWPCGVGGGGTTPSLMLGWAGIGWFYMRLGAPTVPSVLAP